MSAEDLIPTNSLRQDEAYKEQAVTLCATEDEGRLLLHSGEHRLIVLQKLCFEFASACRRGIETAY